jgi:hypothetical protein
VLNFVEKLEWLPIRLKSGKKERKEPLHEYRNTDWIEKEVESTPQEMALTSTLNSRVELIQALIPIGLSAVAEELKREVEQLAGIKRTAGKGNCLVITAGGLKRVRSISLTRN